MRHVSPRLALIVAIAASFTSAIAPAQQASPADRFVGNWIGTLATPTARLRLALSVTRDSTGALSAAFLSLDQGNAKIPATVTLHGDTVSVLMTAASASYIGVITAAGDTLHGTFTQGAPLPLDLARSAALPAVARPQEPKPPFPYRQEDVTFESAPGVRLAGTVVIPAGAGPFPAVVFATGSGPQNRDEELLGHKPFLVISDYLARHGIASLRFDDRGTAKSTGNFASATSADFANDVEAGVRYLRARTGIASDHVGIIGHSEGGLIAPIVAARSKDVAFIVLLAGPGIAGDSILLLQQALIASASGVPQAAIDRNTEASRRMFAELRASTDSADAVARLSALSKRMIATLPPEAQATATQQLQMSQVQLVTPWMRYFITYDPQPTLQKVRVPVLAMNGALDLQVPPKQNLPAIEAALQRAGNRDVRIVEMPGLNHLFQTAKTGNPSEYAAISETFSPAALDIIATWINAHTGGKK